MDGTNTFNGFFQTDDPIVPEPIWEGGAPQSEEMKYLHPWMTSGRTKARQWMEAFIAEWKVQSDVNHHDWPAPARFHFDSEIGFVGSWLVNHTRIFEGWTQDPRWSNDAVNRVRGTKDYLLPSTYDKTMPELYDQAKAVFVWPNLPLSNPPTYLNQALNHGSKPHDNDNRKYAAWLNEIMLRALDGNMKYCAYDVIKAGYPPTQYPNLKVSNYGYATMDGMPDSFGWHTSRDPNMAPLTQPGQIEPPYTPQRKSVRGMPSYGQDSGTWLFWNDFVDSNTQRPSQWPVIPTVTSGDFSSPVLYTPHPQHYSPSAIFKNYYLPLVGALPDWQNNTASQAAISYGRRWMESTINSPGGDPLKVVPWIPSLGATRNQLYIWQPNDMRDLLAMLRAKKTPELIIWWNNPSTPPAWIETKPIMDRVYEPQLSGIRVVAGTCTNCPTQPAPTPLSRLEYTLRETNPSDEYVELASTTTGFALSTLALQVTFTNLSNETGPVTLNLENVINTSPLTPASEIRGNIYVWNGQTWVRQAIDDYPNSGDTGFGFFAPSHYDDLLPDLYMNESRRTFENIQKFVVNGKMEIKFVLQRATSGAPFKARFDLVQLVDSVPATTSSMAGDGQGADFNYTQEVTTDDITGFYEAYTAGEPAADFNNDEVVDAQDLAEYTLEYVNPK